MLRRPTQAGTGKTLPQGNSLDPFSKEETRAGLPTSSNSNRDQLDRLEGQGRGTARGGVVLFQVREDEVQNRAAAVGFLKIDCFLSILLRQLAAAVQLWTKALYGSP